MRITLFFFFVSITGYCQNQVDIQEKLKGKINANMMDLEGIYVINLETEQSTRTEKDGFFLIKALPGDTLIFSAINLKENRIVLKKMDFEKDLFVVEMEILVNQLDEVMIRRYANINAVALGISPKGIIHRTQEERKLYTATSTAGDALLNFMSGRTAMIKKEIEVEKKNLFIMQLDNMFDDEYFQNDLKIPSEYIKGFKYYIVDNEKFTNVLKTKNKTIIDFLMGELAIKYNEIIACENE